VIAARYDGGMATAWRKAIHLLELTRIELVFASVSNAWMVVFISAAIEPQVRLNPTFWVKSGLPLWLIVLLSGVTAAGLSIYGIALNDVLDARRDRAFAPTRPIPAGRVAPAAAVVTSVVALLLAVASAVMLGRMSVLLTLLVAGAILFYNATGKHLPAVGAIVLGLIHAGAALIPNPTLGFTWPVWAILTHVMAYAVLTHRLESKRPHMTTPNVATVIAAWVFVTLVLVAMMTQRNALHAPAVAGIWFGPILAAGVYVLGAWLLLRAPTRPRRLRKQAALRYGRWAVLCSMLLDAGWLAGVGQWWPAALALKLAIVAWILRRLIELLGHLSEPPPGYRLGIGSARSPMR
jgi:4-hydroxybenzoate polyprenyltransferase